jgi:hypothetical protein
MTWLYPRGLLVCTYSRASDSFGLGLALVTVMERSGWTVGKLKRSWQKHLDVDSPRRELLATGTGTVGSYLRTVQVEMDTVRTQLHRKVPTRRARA